MTLNQELSIQLDYFRLLRRQRVLTATEFGREKRRLEAIQEKLNQEARSLALQQQFLRREAEKKAKRIEARRKKAEARNLLFRGVSTADITEFLRNAYSRTAGQAQLRIRTVGLAVNGAEDPSGVRDITIIRPATEAIFLKLFFVYEGGNFYEYMIDGGTLEIYRPTLIVGRRMNQRFRDGISHCVFTPIFERLDTALKSTQSKERKTRLKEKIAKLTGMSVEYEAGVPVEAMETVAKASGYKLVIHDILGKDIFTFNEAGKAGTVRFTNTRPNHIDEGKIVLDCDSFILSESEMRKKWDALRESNTFYMIEGDLKKGHPRKIRTIEGVYELHDPDKEYYEAMNELVGINQCRFNATKYPEVNEFIKAGRIINSWVTPFSDEKPTGHIDMPKAYTQFKKCSFYKGFMGVVHQWRSGSFDRQFLEDHIGIYQVKMKSYHPLFNKLGISGTLGFKETIHILPSPEILYFMDNGVQCEIVAGVWGSRMDFDFPDDMIENKRYAKWCGRLSMEYHSKKYSFHCEEEWAENIKADYGEDCSYWEERKVCSVKVPIKSVSTTHHILAFITSYVRIQMMEALKKFDLNQLVRVVMDGIYFRGAKPECLDWFVPKDMVEHSYTGFAWYTDELMNVNWSEKWIGRNTLLSGQGGAGKTYKVMNDTGFNRILFVTPQHILGAEIAKKYSVPYTTIHRLIGEGCEAYKSNHPYPPVLFIDEVTQISKSWIEKVFVMYKDSLVILAGDLDKRQWFQCRNGKPGQFSEIWKPVGVDCIEIQGDRRSRDDELRQLKLTVRDEMKRVFIDGDGNEDVRMKLWARRTLPMTSFDTAVSMFQPGDVWIAGTNDTSQKLLENNVCSGWYKRGGYVEYEEHEGYDKRGSFTIHSFQGRTVETGKIFISINDLFEYSMLYTAISRAVEFKQLVFIG
jgi:hypothetical protein